MTQAVLGIPGLTFGGAGIWTLVALAVVWIIRIQPKMRELQNNADGSLRKDLMDRIDHLEKQLIEERRECVREMDRMRSEHNNEMSEVRGEMKAMQATIDGLHKQLIEHSARGVLQLPASSTTPRAREAAERIIDRIESEEGTAE